MKRLSVIAFGISALLAQGQEKLSIYVAAEETVTLGDQRSSFEFRSFTQLAANSGLRAGYSYAFNDNFSYQATLGVVGSSRPNFWFTKLVPVEITTQYNLISLTGIDTKYRFNADLGIGSALVRAQSSTYNNTGTFNFSEHASLGASFEIPFTDLGILSFGLRHSFFIDDYIDATVQGEDNDRLLRFYTSVKVPLGISRGKKNHGNKVLFTDVPEQLHVEIPEVVIQVGDILDINITSLNSQSTSIFAPTSLDKIGTVRNLEARKLDGYIVDRLGYIDIPIIGKLHVAAMSCSAISDSIKTKSKEYVLNPNVRVKVLNFRVSVLGEVNSPGTYDVINQKISLLELISRSGGLSKAADASRVMILRDFNEEVETRYIDLTTLEFMNSEFYYLRQNDEVYVLPDGFSRILDYGALRYMGWGFTASFIAILNYFRG